MVDKRDISDISEDQDLDEFDPENVRQDIGTPAILSNFPGSNPNSDSH